VRTRRGLIVAILAGPLVLLPETSRAEAICGKQRPLKPVHCVCGKLIDQSGGPVSGALVRLNREGAEFATVSTDADGKFLFSELKSDKYELAADFDGFRQFRSPISLTKPEKKCRQELVIVMVLTYPDNRGSYVMRR
jgi:carboxypeptidase family protein